ncbi:MAG: hypothetical protein JXQ75_13090, partial [Phycisphaerae bacterium]|nr:hypothetical protein [Phycisphaerae bacterium]
MLNPTSTTLLDALDDPRDDLAWRRFYARYTPMLLSYAQRVGLPDADAQDVVAETLRTFVEAYWAGCYERRQGRLKSWLGGIVQTDFRQHDFVIVVGASGYDVRTWAWHYTSR